MSEPILCPFPLWLQRPRPRPRQHWVSICLSTVRILPKCWMTRRGCCSKKACKKMISCSSIAILRSFFGPFRWAMQSKQRQFLYTHSNGTHCLYPLSIQYYMPFAFTQTFHSSSSVHNRTPVLQYPSTSFLANLIHFIIHSRLGRKLVSFTASVWECEV